MIETLTDTHLVSRKLSAEDFNLDTSTEITSGPLRKQLLDGTVEQQKDRNAPITADHQNINDAVYQPISRPLHLKKTGSIRAIGTNDLQPNYIVRQTIILFKNGKFLFQTVSCSGAVLQCPATDCCCNKTNVLTGEFFQ